MNIIIIGLGSMGKRRIRLLKQNFPGIIIAGVDLNEERRNSVQKEFGVTPYHSLDEAVGTQRFECAFICTAPLSHAEIIAKCLENKLHVFTELNLVSDGYERNLELAKNNSRVLFLSSTFLYRMEPQFIINRVAKSKSMLSYTYHVGQYLPDWHPWESYKDFFVSDKRTNGCREIFAIEMPWLIKAFGKISSIHARKTNISSLNLGYPDSYHVFFEHESGHRGQLAVDVVTRVPVRHFEVFGEDLQIEWRGTPEQLYIADDTFQNMNNVDLGLSIERQAGYASFVVENSYLEELKIFFDVCNGKKLDVYTIADDLYTLELIDRIEE